MSGMNWISKYAIIAKINGAWKVMASAIDSIEGHWAGRGLLFTHRFACVHAVFVINFRRIFFCGNDEFSFPAFLFYLLEIAPRHFHHHNASSAKQTAVSPFRPLAIRFDIDTIAASTFKLQSRSQYPEYGSRRTKASRVTPIASLFPTQSNFFQSLAYVCDLQLTVGIL